MPTTRQRAFNMLISDLRAFDVALWPSKPLREYQLRVGARIVQAVLTGSGGQFCIVFSRQSGKDELLARVEALLLARYRLKGGSVVAATPTFKPQALVARRRLVSVAQNSPLHPNLRSSEGYRVVCNAASVSFLSAGPDAQARGETADLLLVANEAQDISTERWDPVFSPMAASTNAPELTFGTPWLAGSLLSRQMRICEGEDSLYMVPWREVAEEVPAYGEYVRRKIAQLGANHPFIRSEYELEELGAEGGLFPEQRRAQMRGVHARRREGEAGKVYALLLDVAGEDEDAPDEVGGQGREKRQDSTALTVVEVDTSTVKDPVVGLPTYRVVDRREWRGRKHTALYQQIIDLATSVWRARYVVVDATGIGAGLSSFLGERLGVYDAAKNPRGRVIPFVFSLSSKSKLGWAYLGCVESGRYKEYVDDQAEDTRHFWKQVEGVQHTVDEGPGRIMRWSVPSAKGHDDLVMSAALSAVLDELDWRPRVFGSRVRDDFGGMFEHGSYK